MRTIQIECPCGRLLRVGEQAMGKKARCPDCGAVLIIPQLPTPSSKATRLKGEVHGFDDAVTTSSKPLKIQTPAWLLYFGLLTAAAIAWGAFATWKLQMRTVQMEESRKRAEDAVSAAKAVMDHAEGIRKEAEAIMRQAKVTKPREEEQHPKGYSNLRKIAPGENSVNQRYVESFRVENGVVYVKMKNTTGSSIKPNFTIIFCDKDYNITDCVNITWFVTIEAGESRSDGQPIRPNFGPPVYYTLAFKQTVPSVETPIPPAEAKGGVGQDENASELSRIEEAFKNTGISQAKREEIFRALCLAELRAQREADQRFPLQDNPQENLRYHDTMTPKYERAVYEKYGITTDQADLISLEAHYRKWPLPRD
ncbi:MAG: hypothetical protein ACLQU5_04525 [Isosphaeraceae bacterium]